MRYRDETCENDVVHNVCVYLNAEANHYAWRNNSHGVWDDKQRTFRRPDVFTLSGVSDVISISNGKTYFIECKYGSGKPSKAQQNFADKCRKHGIGYYVVYSFKELMQWPEFS